MSDEPFHDWHGDGSTCECVSLVVGPHLFVKDPREGFWRQAEAKGHQLWTGKGVPDVLLDQLAELQARVQELEASTPDKGLI